MHQRHVTDIRYHISDCIGGDIIITTIIIQIDLEYQILTKCKPTVATTKAGRAFPSVALK
jgi:hypothetical protein